MTPEIYRNNGWLVELEPIDDPRAPRPEWLDLQARGTASFFQSWSWTGSWLKQIHGVHTPMLLRVSRARRTVGLALLVARKLRYRRFIHSRALLVSETGEPACDALTVEHNGLLLERGLEAQVLVETLRALKQAPRAWDEMLIGGVDRGLCDLYLSAAAATGLIGRIRWSRPWYAVDGDAWQRGGRNYLDLLSRNSRYQVRRAMRAYGERGSLNVHQAGSLTEALTQFARLCELHQLYWESRGEPGAFGTPFKRDFHDHMIRENFAGGNVQLVTVRAGGEAVGYLYNFVYDRTVYNYQSGLVYEDDAKLKPGLVCHAMAIQYNFEQGAQTYDLLMGDQRYKQSLATREEQMVWLALRRPRPVFVLERWLDRLRG